MSEQKTEMMRRVVLAALCWFISPLIVTHCFAQKPASAMEAYDYVQHQRDEALKLWGKDSASQEEIERGIKILAGALTYLDDSLVVELARGNLYLKARRYNVFVDLAKA